MQSFRTVYDSRHHRTRISSIASFGKLPPLQLLPRYTYATEAYNIPFSRKLLAYPDANVEPILSNLVIYLVGVRAQFLSGDEGLSVNS